MIQLRELTRRTELKAFVRFPFGLYADNPYWVPPLMREEVDTLDPEVNPAFEQARARYWLALWDGETVGRVAAIRLPGGPDAADPPMVRFGWFDAVDDQEAARALLGAVEDWARSQGADHVSGPHGFCDLDPQGMLVQGFDQLPTAFTIYNHPYYPGLMEACGYGKEIDYIEYRLTREPNLAMNERAARAIKLVERRSQVSLVTFKTRREAMVYARPMLEVLNQSFEGVYGFVPLSERQIDYYKRKLFPFLDPGLLVGAVDGGGRLVGFTIAMPSLSRALQRARGRLLPWGWLHLWRGLRARHTVDFCLVGVRREYQGTGVPFLMIARLHQQIMAMGFQFAESNPILEDNTMSQGLYKFFQPELHKRRRIYRKDLL